MWGSIGSDSKMSLEDDLIGPLEQAAGNQLLATLVLIVVIVSTRIVLQRLINKKFEDQAAQRRRVMANTRNGLLLILIFGMIFIWAPALRSFALSLTAFAVAFIIATKELILCISGSIVVASSSALRVGSWVEIGETRGEVTDQTLLTTTLQELGSGPNAYEFTGKAIVIPNSQFLTTPVKNERFYKRYVLHNFSLTMEADSNPQPVADAMLASVGAGLAPYKDAAGRYHEHIEERAGIEIPEPEPSARVSSTNDGRIKITVSCLLPTDVAMEIEQSALLAGLKLVIDAGQQREENRRR
jgi:small-conductance mechanosensitive channel